MLDVAEELRVRGLGDEEGGKEAGVGGMGVDEGGDVSLETWVDGGFVVER